jgi:MFS family permease
MSNSLAVVNGYNISLWLHITAVMVGFGSTFALAIATPVAVKLDPRHLPYVHQLSIALNRYFATPALVVVLATGFYQVSKGNWDYDFWVVGTLIIVVVLGGILGAVFLPTAKALKEISEREIAAAGDRPYTPSAAYNQRARAEMIAGPITGILLIAAVFLMVTKVGT